MARLYREAGMRPAPPELKELLVRGLAEYLQLPLVLIAAEDGGQIGVIASSSEGRLWTALQHLPERSDGGVVGDGAAGRALRSGLPTTIDSTDPGFLPWRQAAEAEHVRCVQAWPLRLSEGKGVLELFAPSMQVLAAPGFQEHLRQVVERTERFLADLLALRRQRLLASALESAGNAAFITDREGTIVWCNRAFCQQYGYAPEEVRGQNPRFLKSGRQGVRYYRDLWSAIRAGRVWTGETVDRDRSGIAHTVRQTISPVVLGDQITHFLAVHANISDLKEEQRLKDLRLVTDDRTGLDTRAAFELACNEAMLEGSGEFTLAVASLRVFQIALRELGPETEEASRAEIAQRLQEMLPRPHHACELAAGEYALLLAAPAAQADALLEELRQRLRWPMALPKAAPPPDLRVALARFPQDGRTFDALLHHADRQLADQPHVRARRHLDTH